VNLFTNNVFRQMVIRSVRADYLENIFKARIGDSTDIGFVPYLAVAFWPWTAFAESILKASNSIAANAALIGKVAFPVELLPLSIVTATFAMHLAGYFVVLVVLQLTGTDISWLGVVLALPVLVLLFIMACAFALFGSAVQVFVRDVAQILPPLMTFWFFTTPILYSATLLPDTFSRLMQFNPMSWFVDRLRDLILFGEYAPQWVDALLLGVPLLLFGLALLFFRRFSSHFEDFL
jgi:lipopolysaccharide transport system permease protein